MPKSRQRKKKPTFRTVRRKKEDRESRTIDANARVLRPHQSGRVVHVIVPVPPADSPLATIPRSPEGSAGIYLITFVLSVPGQKVFQDSLNFSELREAGDSLLYFPEGIREIKIQVSAREGFAEITFLKNKKGAISHAVTRIYARNFEDANRNAYDIVVPTLSRLSFKFDIPLDIVGFEVFEERTSTTLFSYGLVGRPTWFSDLEQFSSQKEHTRFFSAYREALNSTNVFYQGLSFHKVIEGILANRIRRMRANGSYTKGDTGFFTSETFPSAMADISSETEMTVGEFEVHLGKSFNEVYEHYRELIRNAIAHLSQLDGVINADSYDDISTCERAIPVLRFMARRMLKNELDSVAKPTS